MKAVIPQQMETRKGTHYPGSARQRRALGVFIKLLRASHWASKKAGKRREESGFTQNQFGVMEALFHLGPLDQKELTRKLLTSPGNLTLVIDNLERQGHVQRCPDPSDRRRRVIELTGRGRGRLESVLPSHVDRIVEVMGGLSAREQDQLARLCRKLGFWAAELD